jgi:tight adherence protein C
MLLDAPILISFLAFVLISLLFISALVYHNRSSKERKLKKRVRENSGTANSSEFSQIPNDPEDGIMKKIESYLTVVGQQVLPEKSEDFTRTKMKFLKAGLRGARVPTVYWGIKCLLVGLSVVSFCVLRMTIFKILNMPTSLLIIVFLAFFSFYLPDIWLQMKIQRRKEKILEGLPDALDLLVVCVEAGMGIDSAFQRVGREIELSNKTLSDELKFLNLELRAGKSRQEALRNLSTRIDLEELRSLVTLLIQTDRFGTSVVQALRVYSDSFRTARFQRAEEIAAKLPVKLVFPCILFIFPSLFVAILGPACIRIYQVLLSS